MLLFLLTLREVNSFFTSYEWKVVIEKKYNPSPHSLTTKLDDFVFESAYVERSTIEKDKVVTAPLDVVQLYEIVEKAYTQVRIPLIGITFPGGLDGTTYTVEFGHEGMSGSIKLRWWSSGPEEWESITKWYKEMTAFLNEAIENKDT